MVRSTHTQIKPVKNPTILTQHFITMVASEIHEEWKIRNPKAPYNQHLHVPYSMLSQEEKDKNIHQVHLICVLANRNLSVTPNNDILFRIIDDFASLAHEKWRTTQKPGVPRWKHISDNDYEVVDINVPWNKLHDEWKRENLAAGRAALDAYLNAVKQMNDDYYLY